MFPNGVQITVINASQQTVARLVIPAIAPFVVVTRSQSPFNITIFQSGPPGGGGGGSGLKNKSGVVVNTSFTGSPRKATVTFATPFSDNGYSVSIVGMDDRLFTYESKTASGFTINANSSGALTGEVSWLATVVGEA